jgi:PAS domain S-box-containing protein
MFGYTIHDLPNVEDWFRLAYPHPDDNRDVIMKWNRLIEKARRNETDISPLVVQAACKDGSIRTVSITVSVITDCILVTFDDLTESSRAKNALIESEARFRAVFSHAKDGMLVADVRTKKFILANQAILDMLGYSHEEITELSVQDIHPLESIGQVVRAFEMQARKEINMANDLPVKRKNGDIFYADINSGPMIINGCEYLIGIFRDVTERLKTDATILYERNFSDAVLNSMPGVFYMFDQSGRFFRWNRNFEQVTGYSSDEIARMSPLDLFEGEDIKLIQAKISEVFEKGAAEAEASFISKNGRKTPYLLTGLLSHIGGNPYLIGMGIDITRQKQAEKMQALGQLAGGIAHDFNNQLSAILGFAQILLSGLDDEKQRAHAELIIRAATRSADLIRQLLAFARKGKYQTEPVDIHAIISEVAALLTRSVDKRITITQELKADSCITMGDPNQIQSALLNLAINGRDAMAEGGELIFATSVETPDPHFCFKAGFDIAPGPHIRIDIMDTGKGMERDIQCHIFEPFFTTKKVGEGTGMGLAAVYGTVKNHKGAIFVSSETGKGSTFSIYLALSGNETVAESKTHSFERTEHAKALIMVVDDEEIIRMVSSDVLHALGHEVILCENGHEAVMMYTEKWPFVDLIILDMMMPGITGPETFSELRKINPSARILLSSGYSIDGQAQTLLDNGARGFLQKPFTIHQLSEIIAQNLKP